MSVDDFRTNLAKSIWSTTHASRFCACRFDLASSVAKLRKARLLLGRSLEPSWMSPLDASFAGRSERLSPLSQGEDRLSLSLPDDSLDCVNEHSAGSSKTAYSSVSATARVSFFCAHTRSQSPIHPSWPTMSNCASIEGVMGVLGDMVTGNTMLTKAGKCGRLSMPARTRLRRF